MEIDFNPNRVPKTEMAPFPTQSGAASGLSQDQPAAGTAALRARLSQLPLVRADKLAAARSLLADTNYPPDYVFTRISVLLAIHHKHLQLQPQPSSD